MDLPPIVSPKQWKAAREELLVKEKELTHARDALAAERRRMPRMAVEKEYTFEGPNGPAGLGDIFEGRHQLIIYRFFFEPGVAGWPESGCPGCSWVADQITHPAHLAVAVRTSTLDDPALVHDSVKTLNMFSLVFGIPLSFAALLTGLALGLGTRWGVFRYPWTVIKLVLIVTVILVGAFVITPASDQMLDREGDRTGRLIAAAGYDVFALIAATSLAVYKPGLHFRRRRAR